MAKQPDNTVGSVAGFSTGVQRCGTYPSYKDSGVEWLGDIPAAWEVKKVTWLFLIGSGTTPPTEHSEYYGGEIPWITTSELRETVVTSTEKTVTREALNAFPALNVYPEGSVAVAMYGATIGRLGILGTPAAVNQACCVFSPTRGIAAPFWFYWLQSRRSYLTSLGYGGEQPNLSRELLKAIRVPTPSLDEQQAIAAFLDRETAMNDALVAKKERLIELLQEKRAALITQAVTKGLDPDVPMKDSDVAWLGSVPKHWTVKPLRWAVTFQRGHDLPSEQREDGDVPIVSSSGISSTHSKAMATGPGLVTGHYGTIGEFHLIDRPYWPLNTTLYSNNLHGNHPRFLFYMLTHLSPIFVLHGIKSAVPGVDRNDVHPEHTVLPHVDEQRAIACFLDYEAAKIDNLVTKIRTAIDRLKELRTALISAAVTGKIDVRDEADLTPSAVP